jgi:hypothetical protein
LCEIVKVRYSEAKVGHHLLLMFRQEIFQKYKYKNTYYCTTFNFLQTLSLV